MMPLTRFQARPTTPGRVTYFTDAPDCGLLYCTLQWQFFSSGGAGNATTRVHHDPLRCRDCVGEGWKGTAACRASQPGCAAARRSGGVRRAGRPLGAARRRLRDQHQSCRCRRQARRQLCQSEPAPILYCRSDPRWQLLKLFFELRAGGYNGSTYTLAYDPANDQIKGVYYQAVAKP
jgi:hypothetical protein